MDDIIRVTGWSALIVLAYMTTWFVVGLAARRNDVADVAWGLGFVVIAWSAPAIGAGYDARSLLLAALVTVWGVRLAAHIRARNKGRGEDFRYKQWREDWGEHFVVRAYLQVYLLQGFFMLVISTPVLFTAAAPDPASGALARWLGALGVPTAGLSGIDGIGRLALLGAVIWAYGFMWEAVGDYQLLRFMRDPERHGIMTEGVWRYTRHPNYFGETMQWWGIWLVAAPVEYGWLAVIGPVTITFLLLKVSGVPKLEEKYAGRPEWEAYKERTSKFVPLPPRSV